MFREIFFVHGHIPLLGNFLWLLAFNMVYVAELELSYSETEKK